MLLVVVVNLAERALWVSLFHPRPASDFLAYFDFAQSMAHGGGYDIGGRITAYWPPGWPLFLAGLFRVFGTHLWVGLAAQVVLATGIAVLVFLVAHRITSSVRIGVLGALAWTLLPDQLAWNSVLGTEELFTLITTASLYAALQMAGWRRCVVVGALLGLACVVRPTVLFFPVALGLVGIAHWRRFWKPMAYAALTAAVMLAVISPLTVRNYLALGSPVLVSTNGGVDLWQGIHADDGYFFPYDAKDNPLSTVHNEVTRDRLGKALFRAYALRHPDLVAVHGVIKIAALYDTRTTSWSWLARAGWSAASLHFAMAVSTLTYLPFMAAALAGLAPCWRRRRWAAALLGSFIAYYTAVFAFFPAWDRFRYPLMPVFAVFAGIALGRWDPGRDPVTPQVRSAVVPGSPGGGDPRASMAR